jgi:tetratricopeptide (TPR) repeat protein
MIVVRHSHIFPILLAWLAAVVPPALAIVPSVADQLLEADLLYLSRDSDDHFIQSWSLLEALGSAHPEARDEILWRQARSEKWLGDQAAKINEKLRHYDRSAELAKEAIRANPDCAECHFWLGVAYGKTGQTRGVLKSLFMVKPIMDEMQIVLRLNSTHSGAHHVMGVVYRLIPWFAGGSLDKSITELSTAVRLNGASTIHYLELARSYAAAGEVQKGLDTLDALDRVAAPFDPTQAKVDRAQAAALRRELTQS